MHRSKGLVIAILLSMVATYGCETIKPKASIELNYAFPFLTDYWQHSDRSWQCEQPQFRLELGIETKTHWEVGVYHESMVICGGHNNRPEIYENGAYVKKTWGGFQ